MTDALLPTDLDSAVRFDPALDFDRALEFDPALEVDPAIEDAEEALLAPSATPPNELESAMASDASAPRPSTTAARKTVVPSCTVAGRPTRATMRDRASRRVLRTVLSRLRFGRITIVENGTSETFGPPLDECREGFDVTVTIHSPRAWSTIVGEQSTGLGKSYLVGDWSCNDLTTLIRIAVLNLRGIDALRVKTHRLLQPITDPVRRLRGDDKDTDRDNIVAHYDIGNEFYKLWLDETLMYSSAWFERPDMTLAEAQVAKLDRLCQQLELTETDHLLEIGTGWGGMAQYAAEHYGCRVTTTTISQEQFDFATERTAAAGLADRVTVLHDDYRDLTGTYDKLVSIEMVEAVGWQQYPTYFATCSELLKPHGIMALQAITIPDQRYERAKVATDIIKDLIFPGGCLPSMEVIHRMVSEETDLWVTNTFDLAPDYAKTLALWWEAVDANRTEIAALGLGDDFLRLWEFYLRSCEAAFLERHTSDVQITLVKPDYRREL